MKTIFFPFLFAVPLLADIPDIISRPATENQFSPNPLHTDISGYSVQGGIFISPASDPAAPKGGEYHLTEFQIGQPFSAYVTPHSGYTMDVLGPINDALYPNLESDSSRDAIEGSGTAFRYKYLLYGTSGGGTTVLDFAGQEPGDFWFGDSERVVVRAQIDILREAIAQDPFNLDFKNTLLEIYYDWAVGEAQIAKRIRSELAKIRLGLEPPTDGDSIIDLEIVAYTELVDAMQRVLDVYGELLSMETDGINPDDFDPNGQNAPLGYYIFKNLVPQRSQVVSKFAPPDGGAIASVKTGDETIFTGYKDYRVLLTSLGQRIQFGAELARLKTTRNLNDDRTEARNGLTEAQYQANLATLLEGMFTDSSGNPVDFDEPIYDDTGIRGAKALISNALSEVSDTRSYLNGSANVLGLDPNFLILVPPSGNEVAASSNLEDSFDILMAALIKKDGDDAIGPLAVAKKLLGDPTNLNGGGGAIQAYHTFEATVAGVTLELGNIETELDESLERLTGYPPEEIDQFNGVDPKGGSAASDLKSAFDREVALSSRDKELVKLSNQLQKEAADAQAAVDLAKGIEGKITDAQATFIDDTQAAWIELHAWAGAAAASAAAYQTWADLTSIDSTAQLVTGGSVGVSVGVAGAINTAVQTTAAVRTSMRQQEIDAAAMNFEVALATSGLSLQVQQSLIAVNAIQRDVISNTLEILDNDSAIAQVAAEIQAIYREIDIAKRRRSGSVEALESSYFADPIFFTRAESAIMKADAAFRKAQRFTFFTCRALEYKWQQRFTASDSGSGKTFDIGSIFRARNADELDEIRIKMAEFDAERILGAGPSNSGVTVISLRDQFVTPNPKDVNLTFESSLVDDGFRYSPEQSRNLTKVERFRELLKNNFLINGNLVIDFNTSILQNFDGGFFRGPRINSTITQSGNYRNKIVWTAVHMLSSGPGIPASPNVSNKSGALEYGGLTYFRTRIPVYPKTRANALTVAADQSFDPAEDFSGEYIVAPVRYYEDTELNGRYSLQNELIDQINLAESSTSARGLASQTLATIKDPSNNFRSGRFKERAVAASRIRLEINDSNINALIDRLEDIEIIIQHESYQRPQVKAPTN